MTHVKPPIPSPRHRRRHCRRLPRGFRRGQRFGECWDCGCRGARLQSSRPSPPFATKCCIGRGAGRARGTALSCAHHSVISWRSSMLGAAWRWPLTYQVSGLKWQHGWQYGLGMMLIGRHWPLCAMPGKMPAGTAMPRSIATVRLVIMQGVAALLGLVWLVFSGKLAT